MFMLPWDTVKIICLTVLSPLDNIFALPAEVFSPCLAIVSAVMVSGLFLWPALRYGTGYQTVWEIQPSAETPSSVHWRRFYSLTPVHSALELSGRCALQIYLLTYFVLVSITADACLRRFLNVSVDFRHNEDEWQQLQCVMDDFASWLVSSVCSHPVHWSDELLKSVKWKYYL